ncbi:hypothetical protein KAU33_17000 [Candidatus Dependentiae bacterium]|nr:hypothetical protein [Candidatus Dependentiae bacterium]
MNEFKINFNKPKLFERKNLVGLGGVIGLYFIFLKNTKIQYPFAKSRLIYIGMSEKKTNSIGKRLKSHLDGTSGNTGLVNYRIADTVYFTYLNFIMFKDIWNHSVEDLEGYFIVDFVKKYGIFPICNNKTNYKVMEFNDEYNISIDWDNFK